MVAASPEDRMLARRLLDFEGRQQDAHHSARNSSRQPAQPSGVIVESVPIAALGEGILQRLSAHLARWFGTEGVDTLLVRALESTCTEFPFLRAVQHPAPGVFRFDGMTDGRSDGSAHAAGASGSAAEAEGLVTVVATVIALLGRLIGSDTAHRLVRQCCAEPQREESGNGDGPNTGRVGE